MCEDDKSTWMNRFSFSCERGCKCAGDKVALAGVVTVRLCLACQRAWDIYCLQSETFMQLALRRSELEADIAGSHSTGGSTKNWMLAKRAMQQNVIDWVATRKGDTDAH